MKFFSALLVLASFLDHSYLAYAKPPDTNVVKEDFESFPLKEFTDLDTDAWQIKHLADPSRRFDTFVFWFRWKAVLYDTKGKARYPSPKAWTRKYASLDLKARTAIDRSLGAPLTVPKTQLVLRWLRDEAHTLESFDAYLGLRRLGIRAPVAFEDPLLASKRLSAWYLTEPTKLSAADWIAEFDRLSNHLRRWGSDPRQPERLAKMQRALFGLPAPFAPNSELAQQLRRAAADPDPAKLDSLLEGLAFEQSPAWDPLVWKEIEAILSRRPAAVRFEWTQIHALRAMRFQTDWSDPAWAHLSELLRRKTTNSPYVTAILEAVAAQASWPEVFWTSFGELGRSDSIDRVHAVLTSLKGQRTWAQSTWDNVLHWIEASAENAQLAQIVRGEAFRTQILQATWAGPTWIQLIPLAESRNERFHEGDFRTFYLSKLRASPPLEDPAAIKAISEFVARDLATRYNSYWSVYPLFSDKRWSENEPLVAESIFASSHGTAKNRLLELLQKAEEWPGNLEQQVVLSLESADASERFNAFQALKNKPRFSDATWALFKRKAETRTDEANVLWALAGLHGEWRPEIGWRCVQLSLEHAEPNIYALDAVVENLKSHPEWPQAVWEKLPVLFRKLVPQSPAQLGLEHLLELKKEWSLAFRNQVPGLLGDPSEAVRQSIHHALKSRAELTVAESEAVAIQLRGERSAFQSALSQLGAHKIWNEVVWNELSNLYRRVDDEAKAEIINQVNYSTVQLHPDFWEVILDDVESRTDEVRRFAKYVDVFKGQKNWPPRAEALVKERLDGANASLRDAAFEAIAGRTQLSPPLWQALLRGLQDPDDRVAFAALMAVPQGPWPEPVLPMVAAQARRPDYGPQVVLIIQRIPNWGEREWRRVLSLWTEKKIPSETWFQFLPEDAAWPDFVWKAVMEYEGSVDPDGANASVLVARYATKQKVWPEAFWKWIDAKVGDTTYYGKEYLLPALTLQTNWPQGVFEKVEAMLDTFEIDKPLAEAIFSRPQWGPETARRVRTARWNLRRDKDGLAKWIDEQLRSRAPEKQ